MPRVQLNLGVPFKLNERCFMPKQKSYDEMTEAERQQHELEDLDDAFYKTQAEMDGEEDDSNDKNY